jgi:hypothetical protein
MQPNGCACYLFCKFRETNLGLPRDQTQKCYHILGEREARAALRRVRKSIERKFSLSGVVSGNFVSRRCSAVFDANACSSQGARSTGRLHIGADHACIGAAIEGSRWGVIARAFAKRFGTRRAEPEIVRAGDRDSLHPSRRSGRLTHGSQNDRAPQWACLDQGSADFCEILERAKGLEPSTPTLARSCSTTELHPRPKALAVQIAPATAVLCQMRSANATV